MKLDRIKTLMAVAGILGAAQLNLNAATCSIDGNTYYQTIDGFGFSSAWCGTLTTAKNDALYNTLGFSLLRIRIDQNNSWGEETSNSSGAHSRGAKVFGCPWYIPDAYRSGTTLASSHYGDYCNWLASACNSIGLDYVALKNEPDGNNSDGSLTGAQIHDLLANGTVIGRPIMMADAIGFTDSLSDPTLNDSATAARVTFVSGHLYGNGNYVHQNALNKGKHVWMTEHYIANSRDSINNSVVQAKEIQDTMNNRFSAYCYWWVNDSDASVNLVNQSGTIYKAGYVAGQFAKWIRPGKQRIGCTYNPSSGIYTTAYRGGGLVIVAVNNSNSTVNQTFSVANVSGVTTLNVNRTSSSQNMAGLGTVTLSNNSFTYSLPAQSVTTFHQF